MLNKLRSFANLIFFIFPAALIFILSNILTFVILAFHTGHLLKEFLKIMQFLTAACLIGFLANKINRYLSFFVVFLLYFSYLMAIGFFLLTNVRIDFSFLGRNIGNFPLIIDQYSIIITILVVVALINSFLIYKFNRLSPKKFKFIYIPAFSAFFLLTASGIFGDLDNELTVFAKTVYKPDKVISYYQDFYRYLRRQTYDEYKGTINEIKTETYNIPNYLDNIIILQIESVNGLLVNERNTPNLIRLAKEGIFYPRFYANGVDTILGQEIILCSLPNSFDLNLAREKDSEPLLCLPEILEKLGYKTFFYKSFSLHFANTGTLMSKLKFDEIHAYDIMQDNDKYYPWGYKEDDFYNRVFNHVKANKKDRLNFIYIEVGPTNHWPFSTPEGLETEVPFSDPQTHRENLINTTFLQDKYLATAWRRINEMLPEKNFTVLILSDHGWPAEFHAGNNFNAQGAYEENFIIPLLAIFGNGYGKNTIVQKSFSQMDILPGLMALFNISLPPGPYRYPLFVNDKDNETSIIQIQPCGGRYINLINNEKKYQYDSKNGIFSICDLAHDPDENICKIIGDNTMENLDIIKKILPF